jgi:hypothetical protein
LPNDLIIGVRDTRTDQRQSGRSGSTGPGTENQKFLHVLRPFLIAEANSFAGEG